MHIWNLCTYIHYLFAIIWELVFNEHLVWTLVHIARHNTYQFIDCDLYLCAAIGYFKKCITFSF